MTDISSPFVDLVISINDWKKTSLDAIVDRWNDAENNYNLNMTIVVMRDSDFVSKYRKRKGKIKKAAGKKNAAKEEILRSNRNARTEYLILKQPEFYKECSKHLIKKNTSW